MTIVTPQAAWFTGVLDMIDVHLSTVTTLVPENSLQAVDLWLPEEIVATGYSGYSRVTWIERCWKMRMEEAALLDGHAHMTNGRNSSHSLLMCGLICSIFLSPLFLKVRLTECALCVPVLPQTCDAARPRCLSAISRGAEHWLGGDTRMEKALGMAATLQLVSCTARRMVRSIVT
jgi:hypothetical protein